MKRASCGNRKQDQQHRQRGSAQEQAHAEEHIGDGTGRAPHDLQLVNDGAVERVDHDYLSVRPEGDSRCGLFPPTTRSSARQAYQGSSTSNSALRRGRQQSHQLESPESILPLMHFPARRTANAALRRGPGHCRIFLKVNNCAFVQA